MRFKLNILFLLFSLNACGLLYPEDGNTSAGIDQVIGQMFMIGFRGCDLSDDAQILDDIKNGNLGGVILFDIDVALKKKNRNIKDPGQLAKLINKLKSNARTPLFVAIDQEGGRVNRLKKEYGFPETFSAQFLGGLNDPDRIKAEGGKIGKILSDLGINLDFAPVVDVNVNPDNPAIGKIERSFSSDPGIVSECARMFIEGLHEENILSCIKHFPGHGSAYNDSHKGVTDVTATWSRTELFPFEALIKNGSCDMVMTAHIFNKNIDKKYPATLSKNTITGILREKLSFDGVVVTDDMQMKAIKNHFGLKKSIYLSINSGADIILFANNISYDPGILKKCVKIVKQLLKEKKISEDRLFQSYGRIMRLKERLKN
jgi:beta-N-acetylhexosaminidase